MKKFLVVIVLLLVAGYTIGQKVSGGIIVSPVLSWMKPSITKDIESEGVKFGVSFGIGGDFNLSDNFAFSTGLLVNNFGGKLKYTDSIPAFTVDKGTSDSVYSFNPGAIIDYKLQYIEIPFSLKGKTNEIGYMTYFMKAGISPMFKYQAKGDVSQGNIDSESIKKEVAGFAIGYNVGAGFEYSLGGNTKVLVELVYTKGLTDMTKTELYKSNGATGNEKVILSNIALRLGIMF
ncbi:MAG: porin family protein [Bacteroidota bacterium]